MTTALPYITCDVFTRERFGDNPLAVVFDADGLDAQAMQRIAREFNYSETAFILKPADPAHTARVRIFTPESELPFAGHPTVGSAFAIASERLPTATRMQLELGVGLTHIELEAMPAGPGRISLQSPRDPAMTHTPLKPPTLASMLGLSSTSLVPGGPCEIWSCGVPFTMVPLRDSSALSAAALDLVQWNALRVSANVLSERPWMYPMQIDAERRRARVRMFCPGLGFPEDPATGSAAAALAGYLAAHIEQADGQFEWTVIQGIEINRASELHLRFTRLEGQATRVQVGGHCVPVARGTLIVA
jgi:trans-2,3-dihydro-3-hydroxyanthranilate isomerase